jgi:mono/diheme cytochrome c family protein
MERTNAMKSEILACCMALGIVVTITAPMLALQDKSKATGPDQSANSHPATAPNHDAGDEGERVFQQNCARCHNAPEGFSSRITSTIVRHIRVRANLSRHDEEVIRHYFNQ